MPDKNIETKNENKNISNPEIIQKVDNCYDKKYKEQSTVIFRKECKRNEGKRKNAVFYFFSKKFRNRKNKARTNKISLQNKNELQSNAIYIEEKEEEEHIYCNINRLSNNTYESSENFNNILLESDISTYL